MAKNFCVSTTPRMCDRQAAKFVGCCFYRRIRPILLAGLLTPNFHRFEKRLFFGRVEYRFGHTLPYRNYAAVAGAERNRCRLLATVSASSLMP